MCAVFHCGPAISASAARPPNIILVMADDQGWGDMAYNGHPKLKTPHFDAMAREGIRFDRFYAAAPVCSPTRGSVLTGRTPNRYACYSWGHPLRPQETTLAQTLKKNGYRTGHFGKWHLGSVEKGSPVNPGAVGFDVWASSPNYFDLNPILSIEGKAVPFDGDSSDVTMDIALKFIRESAAKKERFLAVIWFGSPHIPHEALEADAKEYAGEPIEKRSFYAEITAMDRAVGRLRDSLRELGIRDNTVLWYCSDNGALKGVGSSGGRRGHKGQVYDGGLMVPGLLEWPKRFPVPSVVTVPCITSDIFPTVLAAAGVKPGTKRPLDGINLLPILSGKTKERPQPLGFWDYPKPGVRTPAKEWMEALYAEQKEGRANSAPERLFLDAGTIKDRLPLDSFAGHAAWIDGGWKLHRIQNPKTGTVEWELYDLAADLKESRNQFVDQPKRAAAMQRQLESWLQSVARSHNGEDL